jgi:predicted nucleotidyltransferase
MDDSLPGSIEHQQILQTIIDHYASDDSILAVVVFGSLGTGNWDTYSDIDLDIVTRDDVVVDVAKELARLCAVIQGDYGLEFIIVPDVDEGDVVLSNLVEFSIRYHALEDTKPAILETMRVLSGTLSAAEIREAGDANRVVEEPNLRHIVNQCIRYALEVRNAIERERLWMALELLQRIRLHLMEMYTLTHGGVRAIQYFEGNADTNLQQRLKGISASPDLVAVQAALDAVLRVLADDLGAFSGGQYQLTEQQRIVLQQLRYE